MRRTKKALRGKVGAVGLTMSLIGGGIAAATASPANATPPPTRTPIQHVVIIFQENESFDHYFDTYPTATNPTGENLFTALPGTPSVNGLVADSLNGNTNYLSG